MSKKYKNSELYLSGLTDQSQYSSYYSIQFWTKYFYDLNCGLIEKFLDNNNFIIHNDEIFYDRIYEFLQGKKLINKVILPYVVDSSDKIVTDYNILQKLKVAKIKINDNYNIIVTFDSGVSPGKIAMSKNIFEYGEHMSEYIFTYDQGIYADHSTFFLCDIFMSNYLNQHISFDCINYQKKSSECNLGFGNFLFTDNKFGSLFYSSDESLDWMTYYELKYSYYYDNSKKYRVKTFESEEIMLGDSKNKIIIWNEKREFTDTYKNFVNQLSPLVKSIDPIELKINATSYSYYIHDSSQLALIEKYKLFGKLFEIKFAENYYQIPLIEFKKMNCRSDPMRYNPILKFPDEIGLDILLHKLLSDHQKITISDDFIKTYYNCHHKFLKQILELNKNIIDDSPESYNHDGKCISIYISPMIINMSEDPINISKVVDYVIFNIPKKIKKMIAEKTYFNSNITIIRNEIYDLVRYFSYRLVNALEKIYE